MDAVNATTTLTSVGIATEIARAIAEAMADFKSTLPAVTPAPTPATVEVDIDRYLRHFRELCPPTFKGEVTPTKTEDWLFKINELLIMIRCPEDRKVALATSLLEDEAKLWWSRHLMEEITGQTVDQVTWDEFATALAGWFVSPTECRLLQEKFLRLVQGNKTVTQYEREFSHLSRFAGTLLGNEEDKCYRFIEGLRDSLRQPLLTLDTTSFRKLVDAARKLEADQEKVQRRNNYKQKHFQGMSQNVHFNKNHLGQPSRKKQKGSKVIGNKSVVRVKDYPLCPKCNHHHQGDCLAMSSVCFKCHQEGHKARYCQGATKHQKLKIGDLSMADKGKVVEIVATSLAPCQGLVQKRAQKFAQQEAKEQDDVATCNILAVRIKDYPLCPKCKRHHQGECLATSDVCYKCHQTGHISRFCPGATKHQVAKEQDDVVMNNILAVKVKEYPLCPKCNHHHQGECLVTLGVCYKCHREGHLTCFCPGDADHPQKLEVGDLNMVEKGKTVEIVDTILAPYQGLVQPQAHKLALQEAKEQDDVVTGNISTVTVKDYPLCPKCNRHHQGECLAATGVCYKCYQTGHIARFCPGATEHQQKLEVGDLRMAGKVKAEIVDTSLAPCQGLVQPRAHKLALKEAKEHNDVVTNPGSSFAGYLAPESSIPGYFPPESSVPSYLPPEGSALTSHRLLQPRSGGYSSDILAGVGSQSVPGYSGLPARAIARGYSLLDDPTFVRRDASLGIKPGLKDIERSEPFRKSESLLVDESNVLFVDGLPTDCTRREMAHLFRPFIGFKEIRVVHKEPRRVGEKGHVLCFVEFDDAKCALTALQALQGYKFDDKKPDAPVMTIQFASFPFHPPHLDQRRGIAH